MKVCVEVWDSESMDVLIREYVMNHDNKEERKVLGMQCRYAFEAGQCIVTYRVKGK